MSRWPDFLQAASITTTHFLQDTGCVAFPFVDVHPQTIAATLAVSSVPEAVTQAVVVILAVVGHWSGLPIPYALISFDDTDLFSSLICKPVWTCKEFHEPRFSNFIPNDDNGGKAKVAELCAKSANTNDPRRKDQ